MDHALRPTGPAGLDPPSMPPLTHHDIIGLVLPFSRGGFHVDLAASDRICRRLMFKPVVRDVASAAEQAREVLQLDNPSPGFYVLTRTLTLRSGLTATLEAPGCDPGALLARIETVQPHQQYRSIEGVVLALSYRLVGSGATDGPGVAQQELLRGEAEIAGFTLVLRTSQVKGYPADIDITPKAAGSTLPEDLIAVIGWAWSPLRKSKAGWSGTLKARGRQPELSRRIEARLEQTVVHLAHTLTRPPTLYHDTLSGARWGVVLRRALPLLFFGGLIAAAASLTLVDVPESLTYLLMSAPGLLMVGAFSMRETPSLQIPPFPRRLTAPSWQQDEPAAQSLNVQTT